ncbi:MAG: hypothetical protein QHJ34_07520 [bacterium]|jgi:hypothetical protein|nr:hypothetical protein [candidate division KSB1 bacterium]MDH7560068.1 hypothetical protein [bacterium]
MVPAPRPIAQRTGSTGIGMMGGEVEGDAAEAVTGGEGVAFQAAMNTGIAVVTAAWSEVWKW